MQNENNECVLAVWYLLDKYRSISQEKIPDSRWFYSMYGRIRMDVLKTEQAIV
jgi:hypothetical protein